MSDPMYPESVLVANRGEIARRVVRTARALGIRTIVIHHPVDAALPFVTEADEAICVDRTPPVSSYLDIEAIIEAGHRAGAASVHPGYGFLAENASFGRAVEAAGMVWIGPRPETIEEMGDKIRARHTVARAGVPVGGGSGEALRDADAAREEAAAIGYPVMMKASAGGGGIGMVAVEEEARLAAAFESVTTAAARNFGSSAVFLERLIASARHIEVQILGLADGRIVALGERDCSVQRRHQKIAEETPAPRLAPEVRARLLDAAVRAGQSVDYRGAGTVEFLLDAQTGEFVFLEMNTRIQVEHPITEMTCSVDLVEQQLNIAAGGPSSFRDEYLQPSGHAIELRLCAEDPQRFFPSPGTIDTWREPSGTGVRVDAGYGPGDEVTPHFDPLLAKLCVHAADRLSAITAARRALADLEITGIVTNAPFLARLLDSEPFATGVYDTSIVQAIGTTQPDRRKSR